MTVIEIEIIIPICNIEVTNFPKGRGSELVRLGAHDQENRSTDDVERFLSRLRFEPRGKLEELMTEVGAAPIKTSL